MKFAKGIELPFQNLVKPEYQIKNDYLIFNADIENLMSVLSEYLDSMSLPLVFFIEEPSTSQEEKELRKNDIDPFHHNLYYLVVNDKNVVLNIFNKYTEILLHDGLIRFGLLSREKEEIYVSKYKVTYIKGEDFMNHSKLLEKYDYSRTEELVTPWKTFSKIYFGTAKQMTIGDLDAYKLVDELKEIGMYLVKTVAD